MMTWQRALLKVIGRVMLVYRAKTKTAFISERRGKE